MNINIKSKRIISGVIALSLVSSGAIASESSVIGKLILSNSISASAATVYGDWEYEITGDHTAKLVKYNGTDADISIPQGIDGYSITELGEKLFFNNTAVRSVKIPRGIQSIPSYCFGNASNLESVAIPLGVTKIKNGAFARTKNLTSIALPLSVDTIGSYAFDGSALTSINMRNVKNIGEGICRNCTALKEVTLYSGLNTLPIKAFDNCTSLESIILPDNLTTIDNYAFNNCTNLAEINATESLVTIKDSAFLNCTSLKNTPCSDSTVTIGNSAFRNCKNLGSISIPESVKEIGTNAFRDCTGIRSVNFNCNTDTKFGPNCLLQCTALENINVSDLDILVKLFNEGLFNGCKELRTINSENPVIINGDSAKPEFVEKYRSIIIENFDSIDKSEIGFFNDYLEAEIKFVVSTNITDDMSDMEKIKTLHDWVCNKVTYAYIVENGMNVPDPSGTNHVDASVFLKDSTVCDGYARALTLLLNEAGVKAYLLSNPGVHSWCMVRVGDYYFHLDPTHDDSGSDPYGQIDYDHFLISDTDVRKCSAGHKEWSIKAHTSRYKYTVPAQTPECPYSVGDVNTDGVINDDDADLIWYYCNGDNDSIDLVLADTNFDGKVDWDDYLAALKRKLPQG